MNKPTVIQLMEAAEIDEDEIKEMVKKDLEFEHCEYIQEGMDIGRQNVYKVDVLKMKSIKETGEIWKYRKY